MIFEQKEKKPVGRRTGERSFAIDWAGGVCGRTAAEGLSLDKKIS